MDDTVKDWPFPDLTKPHPWFKLRSKLIVPFVGTCSKVLMGCFNRVEVHNVETFRFLVSSRGNRPLITVSNHYSCVDDPGLWVMLRWRDLWSANVMRWSLAAHDICYTEALHSWFFSSGKCIPVVRGAGVYQRAIDFCIDRLQEGQWVHVFPEGKVNMNLENLRLKWGVGRLIYDSRFTPIVLPFYHLGMDSVLPNTPPYVPKFFKKVTIVIGTPIDFTKLVKKLRSENADAATARKAITDVIQEELQKLRKTAEELHRQRCLST